MKNKYTLIKIFGIASLIFVIFAYFLFYFIPTIEAINLHKRQLKDMNYKIENFLSMEKEFSFTNQREQAILKEADEALRNRVPEIKSKEDFIALFTRVFDYIKQLARKDGIYNLVLTSNSEELELNATTLSSDKRSLDQLLNFATVRLNKIRSERDNLKRRSGPMVPSGQPVLPTTPPLLEGMTHQTVFLTFSGNVRSAMNFINHIPWSEYYLRPDTISISVSETAPYYMVYLNVYYIDLRAKNVKQ